MKIKTKFRNLIKILTDQNVRVIYLSTHGFAKYISDEKFVKTRYKSAFGIELNLDNPKTYTEKLQWLKLYDHNPKYTNMVDKIAVKKIVADKIGEQYVVPILGAWANAEDVSYNALPSKFVLKASHDSGGYIICNDKENINIEEVKQKLKFLLKRNYYYGTREWPYKNVVPQIFAEPYLEDSTYGELRDYKFFTFNGEPKVLYIASGRSKGETTADFFDMNGNHLDLRIDHEMAEETPLLPQNFELMKDLAAKLSENTPQLRVDFYEVNGKVYFGEMTFFHCGGMIPFRPTEWDKIFGDWVTLPKIK